MDTSTDQPAAVDTQANPAPGTADPSLHAPEPLAPGNVGDPAADPKPADPAAADPEPKSVKNWYDSLPEDLRNNPTVQKYKTPEDQVKGHLELQKMMGNDKVVLPKDENDEVAIAAFNKAIGVPDEAKGYDIPTPENVEGFEGMQFGTDEFKELAFKHKLTPAQAAGIQNDYVEMLTGIKANSEKGYIEALNQAKADLTAEWGLAYEGKVKLAQSVMNKFAGNKENFEYINAKIGADPIALKFLASVGEQFSEGSLGEMGEHTSTFTKTPVEAKREYDAIMNDPNDVYWAGVRNKTVVSEAARRERVEYVESLLKMQHPATPGQPAAG
jgi:hypothetical protein